MLEREKIIYWAERQIYQTHMDVSMRTLHVTEFVVFADAYLAQYFGVFGNPCMAAVKEIDNEFRPRTGEKPEIVEAWARPATLEQCFDKAKEVFLQHANKAMEAGK